MTQVKDNNIKKPELAVVLAAGMSTRMGEHTVEKPKGFIKVGNEPIIERSVRILLENGIKRIFFGTGYLAGFYDALAEKYSCIKTINSPAYARTGSFFTLYNMAGAIDEDFLLLESDLVYEKRAVSHLCASPKPDVILASGKTGSGDEVFMETDGRGNLVNMSKNTADLSRIDGELVGISKISAGSFERMTGLFSLDEKSAEKIDYETALIRLGEIQPIAVDKIDDLIWTEIDTDEHLKRANGIIYPRIEAKEQ